MLKKLGRSRHGVITVFVVLIMVPVVVITGIMVDVSRLKLFATQIAFASDSYGDVILSEYDNVLKELYGLFAVTQDEEAKKALEKYAKYIGYSFNPNGDECGLSGSMFFSEADVAFEYVPIGTSYFSNENVLMTQVADYMEFRIIEQALNENSVFEMIDGFQNMQNDNEAVSAMKDVGDGSEKVLKEIDTYYELLVNLKVYEQYLADLKTKIGEYGGVLREIYTSSDYKKYLNFLEHEDEIIKAKEEKERLEAADEEIPDALRDLADQYVDVDAYQAQMRSKIDLKSEPAIALLDRDLFQRIPETIDALRKSAEKIEKGIAEIKEKLEKLEEKLSKASEDVQAGIEEDIKEMRTISDFSGRFKEISDMEELQDNKGNNESNRTYFHGLVYNGYNNYKALSVVTGNIMSGDVKGNEYWVENSADVNRAKWWKIPEGDGTLYTELQRLHNNSTNEGKNKKEADEKKDAANGKTDEAVEKIDNEEEETTARDIPSDVMEELKGCEKTGKVPSFLSFFKSGFSFKNAGDSAVAVYDKFLMTEYDFGMFSSRVTGIAVKESEDGSKKNEVIEEKNLNKVPMSKKINYLYGAELEYLYGGYAESKKNLAAARNTICGVRMTMNFISTYSIKEINNTISQISTAAAEAVAATGIGAVAAPLVKVAVSAALRTAVASLETVEDWKMLKNREDVLLFKSRFEDLECFKSDSNSITDLLGSISKGTGKSESTRKEIRMSYEDYLRVLLFVCKSSSTITIRTADLITLNVNQSQTGEIPLKAPLAFKMSEAYTAVKTTCKARLDMAVVPDYMLNMFLGGNETQTQIQEYDDGTIGYTMIRGY